MCPERGFNGNVLRGCPTSRCVQRGFYGNVLRGYPTSGCVQRGFNGNVPGKCVQRGSKINVLGGGGGYGVEALCPGGYLDISHQ